MPEQRKQQAYTQTGGINLYTNPLLPQGDGQIIRAVNVDSFPYGAKIKRPGYGTYSAGSLPASPTNLFSWKPDNGGTLFTYAAAGGLLYYSQSGTGTWTIAGNGTITAGSIVGHDTLNSVLTISQDGGTTRYTTDGMNFNDTSLAPAGHTVQQFQQRIYIGGSSAQLFYSTTNDATNWSTSGTSDSSSIVISGGGNIQRLFKLNNRLIISKVTRALYKWDGYNLIDMASNRGPSSPLSYSQVGDTGIWLNQLGVYTSQGDQPNLISNPMQRYFYNTNGSQIAGTSFLNAPATGYFHDWFLAAGTMTDDFTNETVPNAVIKYNFLKNEFLNWQFNNFPVAMHSYLDLNGSTQLIFGDSTGQTYLYDPTSTNDNGQPIESIIELAFNFGVPQLKKDWRIFWGFFNPGCQAQVEVATSDTFIKEDKVFKPIGAAKEGVVMYRFPAEDRSRFLFVKISESSRNSKFSYYGCAIDANIVPEQ